ncbi:transcription factor RelB isoform X1 [Trachemys scripta elegans]|uniref:transcription factor RelB isoform X1 n=2 Tax=Trachemys scripta elegans TaxID=31138 RepID=UPI00155651AA|nr:transcription factor RelB isoform X1 [Trachemys scripta elegans]
MRDTRGRQPRPEELALPRGEGMRGAARPDPGLVMAHTAQASGKGAAISDEDELEIIEELIKEDGFQPQAPPFLSKASPKGTAKLVPRGSNPAGPTGMLRLMEPTGPSPLPVGLTSFGSSHPAAAHALPLDSQPPLLSQSLSSLQLTPRLVPRGTTPPPASRPHWASPMRSPKEQLEDMLEPPRLVITEQPKQRGMRFRYECEGRSAGSILGESSTEASKTLPAIELLNCQKIPEVKVIACLVWKDWPYRIHPHSLVGKDCNNGLCEVTLRPQVNPKHSFNNLGIQCVKKKEIEAAIEKKLQLGIDPFKAGSLKNHQEVDMNVVRICFQASYQEPSGQIRHLSPVLSEPIFDKKSTNTSELRICRMNKECGPCTGGEELYLLCDKVQKEDIAVVFRRDAWESKADFSQADVHRQIAIVFKTPPYQHLDILEPVEVEVYLQRLTDSVCSEPFHFTYLPKDHDAYGVHVKRKRGMPDVLEELSASGECEGLTLGQAGGLRDRAGLAMALARSSWLLGRFCPCQG